MGFNCLKATEPRRGANSLFTTKFLKIPGNHLINLGRLKGWDNPGATKWFWTRGFWIKNPVPYQWVINPLLHNLSHFVETKVKQKLTNYQKLFKTIILIFRLFTLIVLHYSRLAYLSKDQKPRKVVFLKKRLKIT